MTAPKRIGIAVVEFEQRYLVGIRGPGIPLAGYAEFPGGKCLENESATDCAIRECLEETGLEVTLARQLDQREFEYPHGRVDLTFVLCHPAHAADVRDDHQGFRWIPRDELRSLMFPEANQSVVNLLVNLTGAGGSKPCPA